MDQLYWKLTFDLIKLCTQPKFDADTSALNKTPVYRVTWLPTCKVCLEFMTFHNHRYNDTIMFTINFYHIDSACKIRSHNTYWKAAATDRYKVVPTFLRTYAMKHECGLRLLTSRERS